MYVRAVFDQGKSGYVALLALRINDRRFLNALLLKEFNVSIPESGNSTVHF